jgi:hypothetical protein
MATLANRQTYTQHNRKNHPSLWDTLAYRQDRTHAHTHTHTQNTQPEERPVTMGYTKALGCQHAIELTYKR